MWHCYPYITVHYCKRCTVLLPPFIVHYYSGCFTAHSFLHCALSARFLTATLTSLCIIYFKSVFLPPSLVALQVCCYHPYTFTGSVCYCHSPWTRVHPITVIPFTAKACIVVLSSHILHNVVNCLLISLVVNDQSCNKYEMPHLWYLRVVLWLFSNDYCLSDVCYDMLTKSISVLA